MMKISTSCGAMAVALLLAAAPAMAQADQPAAGQPDKPKAAPRTAPKTPPAVQRPRGQPRSAPPQAKPQGKPHQPAPQPKGQPRRRPSPPQGQPHQRPPQPPAQPHYGQPRGVRPPVGTSGRRTPYAPSRQRVYPVPGIHDQPTPRMFVPHRHYPMPYFAFRPQFWLGFGVYAGYALPYPLMFGYPSYVYDGGELVVLPVIPPAAMYGGLSFDIEPDDAIVVVDGREVGIARDFSPTEQPLTLRPGRHHVELRASGMTPLAFDVLITAGTVSPFSGVLQPR